MVTRRFQTILVPIEFDEGSLAAFRLARNLALRDDSTIFLLHVIPLRVAICSEQHQRAVGRTDEADSGLEWVEKEARQKVEATAREVLGSTIPYQVLTSVGDPTSEILRLATELCVDLVVMATHGRTGVWRATLGNVAENVVRKSACPVMTTHPDRGLEASL